VNPGKLRHRVTYQTLQAVRDKLGGQAETWETAFTAPANVVPLSARERESAARVDAPASPRVEMRYRADVTAAGRLLYNGRTFGITEVINVRERNAELHLTCQEAM
jgi:SPP1 family predicted phage head-tail adaptor